MGQASFPSHFDLGFCLNWSLYVIGDKYYCRRHAGEVLLDLTTSVNKDGKEI
jgi:hypothetical protein